MNKTTKSAQFTPGPWQISAIQNEPEKMSIIDADMCFVAEVWQTYIDGESRQQAHAALIAAAPAMYEELGKCVSLIRALQERLNAHGEMCNFDEEEIASAIAALAQAEGRQG